MYPVEYGDNESEYKYKAGIEFELGTMFRIVNFDPMAVGLKATWFSAGQSKMMFNDTTFLRSLHVTARLGPYFTYKINDDMALDPYYQIGPIFFQEFDHSGKSESNSNSEMGVNHEFGLTFRFQLLSLGTSYRFGKTFPFSEQFHTSMLRLFVGMKI